MSFSEFQLEPALIQNLKQNGIEKPTQIQAQCIPAIVSQKDVLGISATGSGKTLGYALPVLSLLQQFPKTKNRNVPVLVLVPTRELANQVKEVFVKYSAGLKQSVKTMAVFGGVSINPQMKNLNGVDVLLATPGRLLDLLDNKALQLSAIKMLILDEADKMLSLGFEEEMQKLLPLLPKKRQNLLFSATLNNKVEEIKQLVLSNAVVLKVEEEKNTIDLIQQVAYFVEDDKKGLLLRQLIADKEINQALVFCASSYKTDHVAQKLRKNGIKAESIHGKKSQGARTHVLNQFKQGQITVLVATDILARGIDIEFLHFVINYELPRSPKDLYTE